MKVEAPNDHPLEWKNRKGWIGIHVINEVIHGRTRFGVKTATFPGNCARKLVGLSYVVTKFTMVLKSLLVYYTITDKSASARIPL
jgi:hypothetical protein